MPANLAREAIDAAVMYRREKLTLKPEQARRWESVISLLGRTKLLVAGAS